MTCHVSVTFEFNANPPETVKVLDVKGGSISAVLSKGTRQAFKTAKPKRWTSCVAVAERQEE